MSLWKLLGSIRVTTDRQRARRQVGREEREQRKYDDKIRQYNVDLTELKAHYDEALQSHAQSIGMVWEASASRRARLAADAYNRLLEEAKAYDADRSNGVIKRMGCDS